MANQTYHTIVPYKISLQCRKEVINMRYKYMHLPLRHPDTKLHSIVEHTQKLWQSFPYKGYRHVRVHPIPV